MRLSHSPWISMQKENSPRCRQLSGLYAQLYLPSYVCYNKWQTQHHVCVYTLSKDEFHPKIKRQI